MSNTATLPLGTHRLAETRAEPAGARIAIENLNFFYGGSRALKDVSIDFLDRHVTGMIGPSGCGKSTLLRVLNRMYDLYPGQRATGRVMMEGVNLIDPGIDLNRLRGRIGMVFQKPTPFPMSIYDNIAFGVKLHERLGRAEMDERVEWSLTPGCLVVRGARPPAWLGRRTFRRAAAAPVHCPFDRRAARGDPAR